MIVVTCESRVQNFVVYDFFTKGKKEFFRKEITLLPKCAITEKLKIKVKLVKKIVTLQFNPCQKYLVT